jgi:segregation and condensation protein A
MTPELELARTAPPVPVAPAPPIPRETAEKVLGYLVFHRSLLGEGDDGSSALLERYLGLVEKLREGVHVVIPDPVQKATALLFELVLEQEFDPWEIDLARFTEAYLERVRDDGSVNFAVAGRLLYMAWSILYLQSEELLRQRTVPEADAAGAALDGAAAPDDGYLPLLDTPEAVDVTTAVLDSAEPPPLFGMVRHPESRPVSLLELVRAFGEAEAEARTSLKIQQLRERLQEEQRAPPEVIVHGDIPERDLEDAWEEVVRHPVGAPFPFLDLWPRGAGRDRLVAVFLAVLFLARERSLELQQEALGVSPILLVRTAEARRPVAEEA